MKISEILKNSSYDATMFSTEAISKIGEGVFTKTIRDKDVPYFRCLIRNKDIKMTLEETIRQLYIYKLINEYNYPESRIKLETAIYFGRERKRADITIPQLHSGSMHMLTKPQKLQLPLTMKEYFMKKIKRINLKKV